MKDDKKKLMIIGALFVVMLGIGAFQFTKGSAPAAPAPVVENKEEEKAAAEAKLAAEGPKNPLVANALAQRDPFKIPTSYAPKPPEEPKVTQPRGTKPGNYRVSSGGRIPEGIPQFPGFDKTGTNPFPVEGGGAAQVIPEPPFAYQLSGIMLGRKPMAVFIDPQGNQRLVSLGGSLDGDSKVIGIEKGKVTVTHGSKTLQLTLGGNPNEK